MLGFNLYQYSIIRFFLTGFACLWVLHLCYNNLRDHRHQQLRSLVEFWVGTENMQTYDSFVYSYGSLTRLLNTNHRWWMYGYQNRMNVEFRIVGKYGNDSEIVYRDLYIPYAMKEYYPIFKATPDRFFLPPPGTSEMGLLGTHASTKVPQIPLPPLSLHPDVPEPIFDRKIEKYHDNLNEDKNAIRSYLAYFAQKYPSYLSYPLLSVTLYQYRQHFSEIDEYKNTGVLLEDRFRIYPILELEIRKSDKADKSDKSDRVHKQVSQQ